MHREKIVCPRVAGEVMRGLKSLEEVMLVEGQTSSRASVPLSAQENHLSICIQILDRLGQPLRIHPSPSRAMLEKESYPCFSC